MKKRVLYLTADNLTLYEWDQKALLKKATLNNEETGYQHLKEIVRDTPEIVTYLLVDVTEEEYYNGAITHVSYRSRKTYLDRQLGKEFRDTIFKFGKIIGKDDFEKKKDAVFFSALTDSENISKWVDLLITEKVSIAAIYSFPVLSETLVKEIFSKQKFVLSVTLQVSGLRLSFFQDSNLKISRLTSTTSKSNKDIAQLAISEIEKTTQYLKRKRLLLSEEDLDISFFGNTSFLREVHDIVKEDVVAKFKFFSEERLAKEFSLEIGREEPSIDWIFSNFICMKNVGNHYAKKEHLRFTKLRKLIFPLKVASVFTMIISLSWAINTHFDSMILDQDANQAQLDTDIHQNTLNRILALQPKSLVPAKEIEQGLNTLEQLQGDSPTPITALFNLSEAVSKYPTLRVEKIVWRMDEREVKRSAEPAEVSELADSADPTEYLDEVDEVIILKKVEVARLVGTISPFDGNYRHATALVNSFVERLKLIPNISTAVAVALPLNAKSEVSMSGNVATKPNEKLSAKFEIEALFNKDGFQ